MKAGADVNASDSNGDAALYHMAIQATKPGAHDWCAAFDSLIAAGAYVDAQQSVAEITPLMKLCMNANESVADRPPEAALALLKRFLDAGADPNAVDEGALEAVPALDGASL